jgi:cytoskeleton protein RodZ
VARRRPEPRYNRQLVFEIGNSLREARLRQGLDFGRVENETKIRSKYIQALEEEHFEVLPAETYVKGFLRTYAEYLGLDGQLYVDEFNSRFASAEEPVLASRPPGRQRGRPAESNLVVVALAGIVAVAILVVVAFTLSNDGGAPDPGARLRDRHSTGMETSAAGTSTTSVPSRPRATKARLTLTAARGDCWVEVHAGSPTGELLFAGTIEDGRTMTFSRRRLWLAIGRPDNLDAKVNGKRVARPLAESILVTARGIRAQT